MAKVMLAALTVLATTVAMEHVAESSMADEVDEQARSIVMGVESHAMSVGTCYSCVDCGGGDHKMLNLGDPETDIYKIAHGCEDGDDHVCAEHPDCGVGLAAHELGKLWRALETLEGDQLRVVVEGYPMVTYNSARGAVQLISSCGTTIGHLPLGPHKARVLSVS